MSGTPFLDALKGGETRDQMEARHRADGWREAVIAAREGARLIPPDRAGSVYHFAAETVVLAVEAGAKAAGVRFAGSSPKPLEGKG